MASGTQKEIKTLSVYFWESGDMSRLNDDAKSSVNTISLSNALKLFFYQIIISCLGIANNEFAQETCQKEHTSQNHHQDT